MKKFITAFLIILCTSLNFISAQTSVEKKPSPQWWLNSALADTIDQYLFHVEANYNYSKMTGAMSGEIQSGSVNAVVRKEFITGHTEIYIDKTDLVIQSLGMNYNVASDAFTEYLDADITRLLYGEAGYIWERDNTLYIQNRNSWYAGLGLNGLICEQHYLKILFALGTVNQNYSIPVDFINVVKGAHSAFYCRQKYKYVITPVFSLMEDAYYLNYFDYSNRYRLGINLNFIIQVVKPLSIVIGYNYKFDKENSLLGIIPTNTTQTIGFNISL
jgi:Protein of unknown function, DUF481